MSEMNIAVGQRWLLKSLNEHCVGEIIRVTDYTVEYKVIQEFPGGSRTLNSIHDSGGLIDIHKGRESIQVSYWTYLEGQDRS